MTDDTDQAPPEGVVDRRYWRFKQDMEGFSGRLKAYADWSQRRLAEAMCRCDLELKPDELIADRVFQMTWDFMTGGGILGEGPMVLAPYRLYDFAIIGFEL